MSNNVNILSIVTLLAIVIIFLGQVLALSTDYWSETEVVNSTTTVGVVTCNFHHLKNSLYYFGEIARQKSSYADFNTNNYMLKSFNVHLNFNVI